ncbi:UDP-N-acetylmuramoyl-tripeptide--D-alanyl-D-alanine ligase [Chachezhania antarctica]|uniref:UDP-N-acetylmuramoyl-tripeptide--D-alanyl-D- alanine ligase n=1 Tax=Chachezhania antarctica TaxID=2340860 RepID=UPI000EB5BAE8|nr:UDP-N-acetylmuramoyl-tripeptide--D-alanyl-D-alanine ligase [Chachezhania antarctica]|tara:strand:- start:1129 stop:2529 length:1401 start_codon:yes stop_codon:yes gene_type:complete
MTALWTAAEAAEATGGTAQGEWRVSGLSIDTRTIQPGDLFIALKAARDGHVFVADALAKGAAAAMVTHVPDGVADDAPLLVVDDVQTALEALGRAGRARCDARVVAVTGSVGKTSTKEMLATMLAPQGPTHASVASYNNHWGVPLTLARMPRDTRFAVIEIGMNHPGEIAPLARMARPHVAMVTTVAPAHLEAFENIEGIAREKASVFEGLEPGGTAIVNADIDTAAVLASVAPTHGARIVPFGTKPDGEMDAYQALKIDVDGTGTQVSARAQGHDFTFRLAAPGKHFALNALGALAAVEAMGADRDQAIAALAQWTAVTGRGAREDVALPGGALHLIDDSYNANPASLAASLEVLASTGDAGGRRIVILGDMLELGPTSADLHAALADLPAMAVIDKVHCVGPQMAYLHTALPEARRGRQVETSAELVPQLGAELQPGDTVLVKGSLGMKLAVVVNGIRKLGETG